MITTGRDAREKLIAGVRKLVSAVKSTLGPRGRNVILDKEIGRPIITKDGVSVARDVNLTDDLERIGADIIKEAALRTSQVGGDGTSTASVLSEAVLVGSESYLDSPIALKRELDEACALIVEELKARTREVDSPEQLKQIATVSSNGDTEIGELIAESIRLAGENGVITIEQSANHHTYIETKSGFEFDRGFMSPYFINNAKMQAEFSNAHVFLCAEELQTVKQAQPIIEKLGRLDGPTILIAKDIKPPVLNLLVHNYLRDVLQIVAVKAPEFGDRQRAILEDMAAVTNGQVFAYDKGDKFKTFPMESVGKVDKAYVSKDGTVLINENQNENSIKIRKEQIQNQLDTTTSDFDREVLQNRLARISGGVAVVYVGAGSEVELKEKKARVEDAMHATRAAMEEGILPGGGVALLRARHVLTEENMTNGATLLQEVLLTPITTILHSAGLAADEIIDRVDNSGHYHEGFNARNEQFERFYETGVIDPAKVTRLALQNAVSVSGTLLTTNAVVTQEESRLDKMIPN